MSDLVKQAREIHPLESYGFNISLYDAYHEFLTIDDKINVFDYIFRTKRYKRHVQLRKFMKETPWYIFEQDQRHMKVAIEEMKEVQREFPEKRSETLIPFVKRDVESNFSLRFEPAEKRKDSIWIVYERDRELFRASISDMWKGEKLSAGTVDMCCGEYYAETIFRKLRTSGIERMYYIMTGKIWTGSQEDDAPYEPSSVRRLENSDHE